MRNRFGNFELSPDEAISNTFDFTTNGSKTLPTSTLAKSASQGNLTFSEHSDSSQRLIVNKLLDFIVSFISTMENRLFIVFCSFQTTITSC